MTKNKRFSYILFFLLGLALSQFLFSHCQVPCGIFDDQMRIKMMEEHIVTIEKSMNQIIVLSKETPPNYNQIIRWVANKDKHADELSDIVTYYFMAQRVKPVPQSDSKEYAAYRTQLELLHNILYYTMKTKQSTDIASIGTLRDLLKKFEDAYFPKS